MLQSGCVNYWTGTEGRQFEQEFAAYIGVEHAIAVSNGSTALGAALRSLDLPPGAEVIVTPRTFVATVSEIVLAGLKPVFADVDESSQNITADTISNVLTAHTAAILVVHLAGWPCDLPGICAYARKHGLVVIEDCAQAHGASINDQKVGAWGDIATFSFCQDKIMTTGGEGGMIVTNLEGLAERCWSFKDHGKSRGAMSRPMNGSKFRWMHESIGTNLRLTEIQSAIGRIQLTGLDDAIAPRNRNAAILFCRLADVNGLRLSKPPAGLLHAFYKFYVFVKPENLGDGWSRDRILSKLTGYGIPCGSGICSEVYLERAFMELDIAPAISLPVARHLGETSLMFRVDPALTSRHMHLIADAIIDVVGQACR
ncbi:MAG: DegT/DnrJ/EryC1/StrS family aminotransferase [Gammaproteobacteria bacterium]|nr:DegT/DnrJ/EryC1/StrS family aminotransferase [Gammaproteobacteria bacterium]